MSQTGLAAATALMEKDGAPAEAIAVFSHYYAKLESGESGLISEGDIEPVTELPELDHLDIDPKVRRRRLCRHGRDQVERRAGHVHGAGPGQVVAAGQGRADVP